MQNNALVPLVGHGLLTSEGEFWQRQRRIIQPAFHHKRLEEFAVTMVGAAEEMLARWRPNTDNAEPLEITVEMARVTLDIICRTMFGAGVDAADVQAVRDASAIIAEDLGTPSYLDLFGLPQWLPRRQSRRVRRAVRELRGVIGRIIARRRTGNSGSPDNLLGMLLDARDEETGERMSDEQLRDEVITIFLAGHDTTANGLSWSWYLLSQHPEAEARLNEEISSVLNGRPPTYQDLAQLPYARMVFEEALRLFPPAAAFMRQAIKDDQIGDLKIPAGAQITITPWLSHRHRSLWDRPDDFDPERFSPGNVKARHKFSYIPFGAGPRMCVGKAFAMMEGPLVLATVAQRYKLNLVPGHPVEPMAKITLWPRHGLQMTITPQVPMAEAAD